MGSFYSVLSRSLCLVGLLGSLTACEILKEEGAEVITDEVKAQQILNQANAGNETLSALYRPSYTEVRQIIAARCVGCHNPSNPARRPLTTHAEVVAFVNVASTDLGQSDLYNRIRTGTNTGAARMPPAPNAPLTSGEQQAIADWIQAGAPNN